MISVNLLPQPHPHARWPLALATIFVCAVLGGILLVETDARMTAGRIYPGVLIGGIPVDGLTPEEAEQLVNDRAQSLLEQGFTFLLGTRPNAPRSCRGDEGALGRDVGGADSAPSEPALMPCALGTGSGSLQGEPVTIPASFSATQDLDLTYDIAAFDTAAAVAEASRVGQSPKLFERLLTRLNTRIRGIDITPTLTIDRSRLIEALRLNYSHRLTPATNADILFARPSSFTVLQEKDGTMLTYDAAINTLREHLVHFSNAPIAIERIPERPTITAMHVESLVPRARALIERPNHTLTETVSERPHTYTITRERLGSWLTVESVNGVAALGLDQRRVDNYLATIAPTIEVAPRDAKFSMNNGRVVEFQSGQVGYVIDRIKTYENLRVALLGKERDAPIALVLETITPRATNETVNNLGVNELLGVGHSNFKGSPPNRRHNIRTGAKALHGIIIGPGEEFSLLNALGDIDGKHGYLPELVIKGNKTVPEFGGGLCQIGTTIFRATMASGLPILERQNHSYSVTYYLENGKPGKDATIYGPKPDYRFRNDTPAYILIQTRIEGDDLYFEFWGTKDGRVQEQTEVKTWGLRKPAPTKIIETEDLEPGKKKCTERPHNGISAEFTYIVTLSNGERREQTFRSTYRPWQEVCLLGVPKGSLEKKNAPLEEALPNADTTGTAGN